jgi:hypothetical protein
MKHPLVKKLEEKLLPEFKKLAEEIKIRFPYIMTTIDASPTGSLTQYQGYSFYIECFFDELEDETDAVFFGVSLGHLTTIPKIDASVGWGGPAGGNETSFRNWSGIFPNDGIIVTEEILEELYEDLPRHYDALLKALEKLKTGEVK